jgi:hypothetical protein
MGEQVLERMLREGRITALDVLQRTAAQRVGSVAEMLLRFLPHDEVCRALYERIGSAPLADFEILKTAYIKHCDHTPVSESASARAELAPPQAER